MSASSRATSRNEITLNDKGVIVARISGPQNQETSRMVGEEIKKLAYERKASGQRVLILCDLSSLRPKDVAADARREARTLLDNVSFDKAAVYGAGSWLTFIMYLVKVAGLSQKVQFFKAKRNALQWLEDVHPQLQRSSLAAWFGVIIGLIGLLALCGWQLDNKYFMSWIPAFRPINPISALGVFIMGIGFILYWMRKIRWLRLTGVISLCIGVGALLPFGIDYLLYGTRVAAYGEKAFIADSAAICFIAMGVVALVAARNGRWVRPVEYAAVLVMGSLALINIFGQLYAQEWLHGLSGNFTMAYNLAFAFALATAGLILLVLYRKMKINLLTRVTWAGWLIVAVLIFVQVATYTLWDQANARQRSDTAAVFTKNAQSIEEVLTDRFAAYTNALRGYQGLFASSNTINQVEFESYYNATEI
ncbi:MAG TPA: STAS/SEC14 domain-containing protein, partial [Candidatus Saccharimonadales bacterium]|nr:STAS/SEC14 domain-containing protein [Candidatus Saccharimonadales bacterium]